MSGSRRYMSGSRRYLIRPGNFVLVGAEMIERALCPGQGEAQALLGARTLGGVLGALVEGHADVCAESDLDVHGMFWSEEVAAAVEVGAEVYAFVGDLAQGAERKDLKAARVGEHGAGPTDELVQAAHAADGFVAGAQVEVVSVAEDDLSAEGFEDVLGDGLDGACGADRHEDRRLDGLVGQVEGRAASAGGGCVEQVEVEAHPLMLVGDFSGAGRWGGGCARAGFEGE